MPAGRAAGIGKPPEKVVPGARSSRGQVSEFRDLASGFSTGGTTAWPHVRESIGLLAARAAVLVPHAVEDDRRSR